MIEKNLRKTSPYGKERIDCLEHNVVDFGQRVRVRVITPSLKKGGELITKLFLTTTVYVAITKISAFFGGLIFHAKCTVYSLSRWHSYTPVSLETASMASRSISTRNAGSHAVPSISARNSLRDLAYPLPHSGRLGIIDTTKDCSATYQGPLLLCSDTTAAPQHNRTPCGRHPWRKYTVSLRLRSLRLHCFKNNVPHSWHFC